jgi:hypothetical protein
MSDIRKSLESLADSIELLENRKAPEPEIKNRSLSGDKIHGGTITNFASRGIIDESKKPILLVRDNGIHVDHMYVKKIENNLNITGDLNVQGEIYAAKLHVDEVSADIRNERTSPLEFKGEDKSPIGKGIIWTGGSHTKQLILQDKPERLWSSEDFDLHREKSYMIGGENVISETSLGTGITKSNLKSLGTLNSLDVAGHFNVGHFVRYNADTEQFSIGVDDPNGMVSIGSLDHEFVIDPTSNKNWKIGTWTTSGLDIITDDTVRIKIENSGTVRVLSRTSFDEAVGIGVKNFESDCDLTIAGAIRFQNAKHQRLPDIPKSGNYQKGDIVWSTDPKPTGFVGWVCVREGTPGEWKGFGQISA